MVRYGIPRRSPNTEAIHVTDILDGQDTHDKSSELGEYFLRKCSVSPELRQWQVYG